MGTALGFREIAANITAFSAAEAEHEWFHLPAAPQSERVFREPTRGFEPRTPSLRVTAKEGAQSLPVPPGCVNKPKQWTPKESEEPQDA
jgi:hypothetical protein